MLGLGSINRILNNLGLAAELQSTKLVVESASNLNKYIVTTKMDMNTIATARAVMAELNNTPDE